MEENTQNKKESNSERKPLDKSILSSLQYVKVIFLDTKNELHEIQTESNKIDKHTIILSLNSEENYDVDCPTGAVLKFVTTDSIYFAKTIMNTARNVSNKLTFALKTPKETIKQQNRKHYRILKSCPCVLLCNNDKNKFKTYIAQSINISKGGILLGDVESVLNDRSGVLQPAKDGRCYIVMFLRHNIKIKTCAKFIRTECVNELYRYAFEFSDMEEDDLEILDKFITNEKTKILKSIKQD